MAEPVIIEAAINGVTSKKHNPNTPKEPAEIADDALPELYMLCRDVPRAPGAPAIAEVCLALRRPSADPIGEELRFRADLRIEAGQDEGPNIIAKTFAIGARR